MAFALAASLCWGLADFIGGMETKRLPGIVVCMVGQGIGLAGLALLLWTQGDLSPAEVNLGAALIAGLAIATALTALYEALAIGTMSIVAPIAATGAIVPVVVGISDGDDPSSLQVLGMVAAALGILLASQHRDKDPGRRRVARRSIYLALLTAAAAGVNLAALDRAADPEVLPAVMWARLFAVTALVVVMGLVRPALAGVRSHANGLVAIGVLDAVATSLFVLATTEGLLSVVALFASLYPVVTVLLARAVLAERIRPLQAAGIVSALAGVALVVLG